MMGAISKAQADKPVKSAQDMFRAQLERSWPRIAAVAPKAMNKERMFQLALSAYNQTPDLAKCSTASVLGCLMKCTALGMEPSAVDGLGRAYILPFVNVNPSFTDSTNAIAPIAPTHPRRFRRRQAPFPASRSGARSFVR